MRAKRYRSDCGSAIVDFLGFGVLLQLPVLIFASLAIQNQHEAFALDSIARHTLRSMSFPLDESVAARTVLALAADFRLDVKLLSWNLSCVPDLICSETSQAVEIRIDYSGKQAYAISNYSQN